MRKRRMITAVAVAMACGAFAGLEADFTKEEGRIRPALHSSGFGPLICGYSRQPIDDIRAMNFKYARTHDWALINANQRVCDWHHIFPLKDLDPTDPKNYVFAPTDYLLKRTREETGLDIFFRLGTSIEHSGPKVHFNAAIPEDFDKVAEVFAGTVRHYNRGWAGGHRWNIRYWEIWNEPDGQNTMWCLPGGDTAAEGQGSPEQEALDRRRRDLFVKFYVKVLKRLKDEFGDEIRVGGPALCAYLEDYFTALLQACKDAGVTPDFISWHSYACGSNRLVDSAEKARRLCDGFGFTGCELIVNEWHYFGENYGWGDLSGSDHSRTSLVWDSPDGHNAIRSACFVLTVLSKIQRSKLDQAYYYGCRHTGSWGYKDEHNRKYKVFHSLKLFGTIVRDYTSFCASTSEGTVTTFAVKDASGEKKGLLVVDYGGTGRVIKLKVAGVPVGAKASCRLLDNAHDLTAHDVKFQDGWLTLEKPDFHSAAFFVEFGL